MGSPQIPWEIARRDFNLPFQNIITLFFLDAEIIAILEDVQYFTDYIIYVMLERISTNLLEVDHMAAKFRYRLLCCVSTRKKATQEEIITERCRLGASMHLQMILQSFPRREGSTIIRLNKLKLCIERLKVSSRSTDSIVHLTIWILFLGGISSSSNPKDAWFIARLSSMSGVFPLPNLDAIN
jgi:hypothetical protein